MLHLTQETDAFSQTIQQCEMRFWAHDRERNTRQARSRTHVDKTLPLQIRRDDNTVQNMAHQHFVGIPYRRQVVRFVPFVQHIDIRNQLIFLGIGKRNTSISQQTREFVEHGRYLFIINFPMRYSLSGLQICRAGRRSARRQNSVIKRCGAAYLVSSAIPAEWKWRQALRQKYAMPGRSIPVCDRSAWR